MNRSLKLSVWLALALGSSQAAALELGQIQIKSALGQPLVAEIPIKPDHPGELDRLTARLASAEDFSRAGVAAPTVLLQFAVIDASGGQKIVRVTSSAPVNDPYLDLLVELNTGSSKSVREFAVLLDPPAGAAVAQPAAAPAAPRAHHAPAPAAAPAAPAAPAAAPAPARRAPPSPSASPAAAANGQITVQRGQTLSGIAKQSLPAGVDINQMLLAYKQANPDAFYRDNVNALKTGAVLRVPGKDEAEAVAAAAALAEVRRQNSDWRAGAARTPTNVADAGTRADASSSPAKNGGGDRLALVPAKDGGQGGAKGNKAEVAAMHQDLQRSQEQLASLQQQGNDLKSRLKDLEDINSKNERLLALKDNEIAELQHKLADARKAAGMPAAQAPAPAKAPVDESKTVVTATPSQPAKPATAVPAPAAAASTHLAATTPAGNASSAAASARPVASQPTAPSQPVVKPKPRVVAPPPAEETPWFMQPIAWAAGAGVLVLLALLGLLRRRKAAPAPLAPAASSLADRFGAAPPLGSEDLDQEELLDQLAEHPDDIGLHLELVSLYYSRRDVEHFEAAAEAMHAHISDPQQPEWQDVVHMGEDLVPNHPLFAPRGDNEGLRGDERAALHHFDLDQYASGSSPAAAPVPPAAQKVSEYHFDFNLTPHPIAPPVAHEPHEVPQTETAPQVETAHSSWEFADDDALLDESERMHDHDEFSHNQHVPQELGTFSDDPIDTKLDLARAYLDMGDPDGARAMLEEVLHEGSQMQKDTAQRLLDDLH
ncbi:MAG TPA: FimV/HubP family polar landmark protein [Dyella sp.]|uniref:FimV/HubP family polar landmark protein n=1 Tax=Dyella sp. TaxID=1869338 RepID=UPI002F92B572